MMKKKILPLLLASVLAASGCANAQNPDIGSLDSQNSTDSTSNSDNSTDSTNTSDNSTGSTSNSDSNTGSTSNSDDSTGSTSADSLDTSDHTNSTTPSASTVADSGSRVTASDLFSNRDLNNEYEEKGSIAIKLNKTSASCSSKAVKISGRTITITDEGTYILSGTLKNGMVIIDAEKTDKIQLVLNGAKISSSTSAAVYVKQADKVFLTTAANTKNKLSNGGTYEAIDDNHIDAVIYSKDDLTLNGKGLLKINAKSGHGIVSKDSLVLTGGRYVITAEKHGLSGKDDICIANGSYRITSGKDGIHAENDDDAAYGFLYISNGTFHITSEGDGISSSYFGQIEGGSFNILAGGGCQSSSSTSGQQTAQPGQTAQSVNFIQNPSEQDPFGKNPPDFKQPDTQTSASDDDTASTKGIKAAGNLWLDGGTFIIDAADDALHTNSSITIADGSYQIASGDDGIHADDSTIISGGTIDITQSYEGIEGKTVVISGGNITLTADDDGLNAAGGADSSGFGAHKDSFASSEGVYITISGGTIYITASGDGIDSNGDLTISGGQTYVSGPSRSGNGSLDYNGEASITGGIFAASGAAGMAQNFGSSSTQGTMLVQTDAGSNGDHISLADADGNMLVSWQAKTDYDCVIISCPELTQGNTYALTAGNTSKQIEMTSLIYGQGRQFGNKPGGMNGGSRPGAMGGGRQGAMGDSNRQGAIGDGSRNKPDLTVDDNSN